MKQLTPDQIAALKSWAEQGTNLSEIQKRLSEEFSLNMTYMDVRFLLDDLDIEITEKKAPAQNQDTREAPPAPAPDNEAEEAELIGRGVEVELDRLARPGALVSGNVAFSDGVKADWYLDQHGRLGLSPKDKEYRPSQEDVQEFQLKLQELLQSQGF